MWLARSPLASYINLSARWIRCGRQPPRDEPAIGHAPEPEADDADVDAHRLHGEPPILERPVVALDRFAEPLGDRVRLRVFVEIRE